MLNDNEGTKLKISPRTMCIKYRPFCPMARYVSMCVFLGYRSSTTSVGSRQPWNVESCKKLVISNNIERDLINLLAIVKHTKEAHVINNLLINVMKPVHQPYSLAAKLADYSLKTNNPNVAMVDRWQIIFQRTNY